MIPAHNAGSAAVLGARRRLSVCQKRLGGVGVAAAASTVPLRTTRCCGRNSLRQQYTVSVLCSTCTRRLQSSSTSYRFGRRSSVCIKAASRDDDAETDEDDDSSSSSPAAAEDESSGKPLRVERLLANLGYGKRQECASLIKRGRVTYAASGNPAKVSAMRVVVGLRKCHCSSEKVFPCLLVAAAAEPPPLSNPHPHQPTRQPAHPQKQQIGEKVRAADVLLDEEPLDPPAPLTILLHKPVGHVVTSPDDQKVIDPVIYELLPHRCARGCGGLWG